MRTLPIDWADLEIALRDATGAECWLDRETGEVLTVMAGFPDEADLRDRLRRTPARFLKVVPVDKAFTRRVLEGFVATLRKGETRDALSSALTGSGGIARAMALINDDKGTKLQFARFEQMELMRAAEEFLGGHGIRAGTPPPSPELFEGV
jgi:hypothetical protein